MRRNISRQQEKTPFFPSFNPIQFLFMCFYIVLVFTACKSNREEGDYIVDYSIDTLKIITHEHGLSLTDAPRVINTTAGEFYINFNEAFRELYFYNLDSARYSHTVKFKKNGPEKVPDCSNYIISGDTVIVIDSKSFKFIHKDGTFIEDISLKDMFPELAETHRLGKSGITIANLLYTAYYAPEKAVVFHPFRNGYPWEDGFYKDPLICWYEVDDHSGEKFNVQFPRELEGDIFYDDLAIPHILIHKEDIIYHFHYKSTFYLYNRQNGEIVKKTFSADHLDPKVKGVKRSGVKGLTSLVMGPKYHNLQYDPYKDLFYLLYNYKFNGQDRKQLIIFNDQLEKLGEIPLPDVLSDYYAISKKGLLFRNMDDLAYKSIELYAFNVIIQPSNATDS